MLQYASILMGLSNTFATIPGIVSPLITGEIVTNKVCNIIKKDVNVNFYL